MKSHLEVSATVSRALLETLRALGTPEPERLLRKAGIDPQWLEKPENRIPFERQQALWQLAAEQHPGIALDFARAIQPTSFGLLGYMAMNCPTVGDCLQAVVDYQFLAGQGGEFSLHASPGELALRYTPINPEHPATAHRVLAMLAANVSFGRWLVAEAYRPRRLELSWPQSQATAGSEAFFGCRIQYGRPYNQLCFDAEVAAVPVPNASEDLLLLLGERARRLLGEHPDSSSLAARIARLLATQRDARLPDRARVAAQLGLSERTLQRRLREEGTTYQAVLDSTRHYLALELLRNTALSLADVSARLGFAEPSAFFRAFRKWQGTTPGQYRESLQSAPATR